MPDNRQVRRASWLSVAVLTLSAIVLFLSVREASHGLRFAGLLQLAREIDRADIVSDLAIATYKPRLFEVVEMGVCRSDIVRSGLSLVLRDLDRQTPDGGAETWRETVAFADRYLRHALSCLPRDGNIWLRFAMIRAADGAASDEIAELVKMSQLLAPADQRALHGRVVFWDRLSPQTREMIGEVRRADLEILCAPVGQRLRRHLPDVCDLANGENGQIPVANR